jgi:hypothetical protein
LVAAELAVAAVTAEKVDGTVVVMVVVVIMVQVVVVVRVKYGKCFSPLPTMIAPEERNKLYQIHY